MRIAQHAECMLMIVLEKLYVRSICAAYASSVILYPRIEKEQIVPLKGDSYRHRSLIYFEN